MTNKITEPQKTNTNKTEPASNKTDPFAQWKSPVYWKTQGKNFLPLIVGLLITRGLNLAGWRALLGYMVAASTTRQIIDQFDSETKVVLPAVEFPNIIKDNLQQKPAENPENKTFIYKIIHAIPGRIRLNVPRVAEDLEYAKYLDDLLVETKAVSSVRVNRQAASVLVNYNTGLVSDQEMQVELGELIESSQITEDSQAIAVSKESDLVTKIEPKKKDDEQLSPPAGGSIDKAIEPATVAEIPAPETQPETPAPMPKEQAEVEENQTALETPPETSQPATIEPAMLTSKAEIQTEIVSVEEQATLWYCLANITKKTVWWLQRGQPLYSALPLGFQEAVKVRILAIAALATENSSQTSLSTLGSLSYR